MNFKDSDVLFIQKFFGNIKVSDVMNKEVISVRQDAEGSEVQEKFIRYRVNHIVVTDGYQKVVGLISRKYLYKTQSPRKIMQEEIDFEPDLIIDGDNFYSRETLDSIIIHNIMQKNPLTLGPEESFAQVIKIMASRFIACIPIVDKQGHAIGVMTDVDAIRFFAKVLSL
ncbi:MAG TPA: CBS domain-containing protein [Candidatus Omnitrophota bacterium]|nr:CBS domain-containing protein [Candidatus Omnitrophota bacterium]